MNLSIPPLRQNLPFHSVNPLKGNPFLSLRALPFLIVLAGGLVVQPAARAQVFTTIPIDKPVANSFSIGGLVISPDQSAVYVADTKTPSIGVIDASTNLLVAFIPTKHPAVGLAISSDGSTLFVTEQPIPGAPVPGFLEAISISSQTSLFVKKVGDQPAFPGVSPSGSAVYVPNFEDGTVTIVANLNKTIFVNGRPYQAVFSTDGSHAFVSNINGYISVFDTSTGSVVFTIGGLGSVSGMVVKGNVLFAVGINRLFEIDTTSFSVFGNTSIPVPTNTIFAIPAITADGSQLYIPAEENPFPIHEGPRKVVVVVDTSNASVLTTIAVGRRPLQVAIQDVFGYVYVSNGSSGTVSVSTLVTN